MFFKVLGEVLWGNLQIMRVVRVLNCYHFTQNVWTSVDGPRRTFLNTGVNSPDRTPPQRLRVAQGLGTGQQQIDSLRSLRISPTTSPPQLACPPLATRSKLIGKSVHSAY
jgi:hypothetical protein